MKYKLLRNLPGIKAGEQVFYDNTCYRVYGNGSSINFSISTVVDNPEWFELVSEFKVGDIVVLEDFTTKLLKDIFKIVFIGDFVLDEKNNAYQQSHLRLATPIEQIEYYQQQGWVKGAKFKFNDKTRTLAGLHCSDLSNYTVLTLDDKNRYEKIEDCELIKESEYPKRWEDLPNIVGYCLDEDSELMSVQEINCLHHSSWKGVYSNEKQAISALAFAQLSQLHKAIVGSWVPDWVENKNTKYVIERYNNELNVITIWTKFYPLAFPVKEMAEFSLKYHEQLWKQFYQLD